MRDSLDRGAKKLPPPVPVAARSAGHERTTPGPGFSVHLQGASLFDLIQFECRERNRRIVRVRHGDEIGFLYFRDGNVVHALAGGIVGEAAVRAMLAWQAGSFESWEGPWPRAESISTSSQLLLLSAAQAADEEARDVRDKKDPGAAPSRLISFPAGTARQDATRDVDEAGGEEQEVTKRTMIPGLRDVEPTRVRISPQGVSTDGAPSSPEFPDAVAYAAQISDLLGELLGVGPFVTAELSLSKGACVIARHPTGDLIAARGPQGTDPGALRRALGLGQEEK